MSLCFHNECEKMCAFMSTKTPTEDTIVSNWANFFLHLSTAYITFFLNKILHTFATSIFESVIWNIIQLSGDKRYEGQQLLPDEAYTV